MYIKKIWTKNFTFFGTVQGRNRESCNALCSRYRSQGACDSLWFVRCSHVGFILTDAHQEKDEKVLSLKQSLLWLISQIIAKLDEWEKPVDCFSTNPWKAFSRRNHIIKPTVSSHQNLETEGKLAGKPR